MHIDEVRAYQREKDSKMRHGYEDYSAVSPQQQTTHDFVDKDTGDYDNKHLGTKEKDLRPKNEVDRGTDYWPNGWQA